MKLLIKMRNSIKFRVRYFLFSKVQMPSTSFSSLLIEILVSKLDSKMFNRHRVRLSVSLKPDGDEEVFRDAKFSIIYHGKIINWIYLKQKKYD